MLIYSVKEYLQYEELNIEKRLGKVFWASVDWTEIWRSRMADKESGF